MITDRQIKNTRLVDAPRELVWDAWTDAAKLAKWWGPTGFTNEIEMLDVRPGGVFRLVMVGPDGTRYPNEIRYTKVERLSSLAWVHSTGEADDPNAFETEVTFEEEGARTRITMVGTFKSAAARDFVIKNHNAQEGGRQTLGRLADQLAEVGETLTITRTFKASRQRVWDAWTKAENVGQWWGPKGMEIVVHRAELRPGGIMLYSMQPPGAPAPMWGRWAVREVSPIERFAWVNSFSDPDAGLTRPPFAPQFPLEIFNLVTFEEVDGGTRMTLTGQPINATSDERAFFQGMHASMNQGFGGTFAQLAEFLGEEAA